MYTGSASVCCTAAVVVIEAAYADDTAADVEVVVLEEVTEVITAAEVTEVSVASSVEVSASPDVSTVVDISGSEGDPLSLTRLVLIRSAVSIRS